MECHYCNNKFSSKSSLTNHQKRTKYCLKLQGKTSTSFNCSGCDKKYTSKENVNYHQKSCISYLLIDKDRIYEEKISFLQEELKKKELTIQQLQKQIQEVALKAVSHPTTSSKNPDQQLYPEYATCNRRTFTG